MVTQEQIDEIKRRIVENITPEKIILYNNGYGKRKGSIWLIETN
jgi:hypothetical protein